MRTCAAFIVQAKRNEKHTVEAPVLPRGSEVLQESTLMAVLVRRLEMKGGNPKDPLGREVGELVNID